MIFGLLESILAFEEVQFFDSANLVLGSVGQFWALRLSEEIDSQKPIIDS